MKTKQNHIAPEIAREVLKDTSITRDYYERLLMNEKYQLSRRSILKLAQIIEKIDELRELIFEQPSMNQPKKE